MFLVRIFFTWNYRRNFIWCLGFITNFIRLGKYL